MRRTADLGSQHPSEQAGIIPSVSGLDKGAKQGGILRAICQSSNTSRVIYGADGNAVSIDLPANSTTAGDQIRPVIIGLNAGRYAVFYEDWVNGTSTTIRG